MTEIDLKPATVSLSLYQGDDISIVVRLVGDMTDRSFAASIKHGTDEPIDFDADASYDEGEDRTTVTLTITGDTELPSTGRWDFQMTTTFEDLTEITRTLVAGKVAVSSQVTVVGGS